MNRADTSALGNSAPLKKSVLRSSVARTVLFVGLLATTSSASRADESGTSFWLPGQYGSLAAAPGTPGWALATVYYHTSVSTSADVAASREIQVGTFNPALNVNLNANLPATSDLALVIASYAS